MSLNGCFVKMLTSSTQSAMFFCFNHVCAKDPKMFAFQILVWFDWTSLERKPETTKCALITISKLTSIFQTLKLSFNRLLLQESFFLFAQQSCLAEGPLFDSSFWVTKLPARASNLPLISKTFHPFIQKKKKHLVFSYYKFDGFPVKNLEELCLIST